MAAVCSNTCNGLRWLREYLDVFSSPVEMHFCVIPFLSERLPLEVLEEKDSKSVHDPSSAASSDWQQQQLQHLEAVGQEVTQFDILHANEFEPTSTPFISRKGANGATLLIFYWDASTSILPFIQATFSTTFC